MIFERQHVGNSDRLAAEAGVLGVPFVRFNDFVGRKKIGVMEELEHAYGLTYGISSHEPEALYAKISEILAMPNARAEWQKRREKMLSEKVDYAKFLTWFIEEYPASAQETKNANEEFWERFKYELKN